VPLGFDDTLSISFFELANEYDNVSIQIIEIDDRRFLSIAKEPDRITGANYVTTPAWFRLSAATLLKQYDVCIYLDTDTVVVSSLLSLLDLNFGEHYIAGVLAPGFILNRKKIENAKIIGIPDYHSFINSGVLVMNLKLIRRDYIERKFFELVEKGLYDQDVINIVCYGRILALPQKYNLTKAGLSLFNGRLVLLRKKYLRCRSFEEMREACFNPAVVHYPGANKPWNTENQLFGYLWLREAEIFLKRRLVPAIEFPAQNSHSCYLLSPCNPISIISVISYVPKIISKLKIALKSVINRMIKSVFGKSGPDNCKKE
jgi:lipopolysaccharide biosynthesis glycosyltransferase